MPTSIQALILVYQALCFSFGYLSVWLLSCYLSAFQLLILLTMVNGVFSVLICTVALDASRTVDDYTVSEKAEMNEIGEKEETTQHHHIELAESNK